MRERYRGKGRQEVKAQKGRVQKERTRESIGEGTEIKDRNKLQRERTMEKTEGKHRGYGRRG